MHRRVVFWSLIAAGFAAAASPCASAAAPASTRPDLVSGRTAIGDGGNAWGGHQPRIARTARGLFTVYSVPTRRGYLHRRWRLARRTATGWTVIAAGAAGREPPSLVAAPDGALEVVA